VREKRETQFFLFLTQVKLLNELNKKGKTN
jgi:hypothetical protein